MADRSKCWNACHCGGKKRGDNDETGGDSDKVSLIHRILKSFYRFLHRFRWFLLAISLGGFAAAIWGATTLKLPTSSE
eukprot:scaffold8768_cov62-Cylindrotheca_fusiformis.AAC.1